MGLLLLSVLFTGGLYVLFGAFAKYKVHTFSAIIVNYVWCSLISIMVVALTIESFGDVTQSLIISSLLLGVAFMGVFYLLGWATKGLGVAATTIVSRMSMVIPSAFSVLYFSEKLSIVQLLGFALAMIAIYFSVSGNKPSVSDNQTPSEHQSPIENKKEYPRKKPVSSIQIALLAFLGVGITDTVLKVIQANYLGNASPTIMGAGIFTGAAIGAILIGLIITIRERFFTSSSTSNTTSIIQPFSRKNLVGGLSLGTSNYLSLFFFLQALNTPGLTGSVVFPINSVGTVVASTLLTWIFLKERLSKMTLIGILLAIVAILMVTFGGDL